MLTPWIQDILVVRTLWMQKITNPLHASTITSGFTNSSLHWEPVFLKCGHWIQEVHFGSKRSLSLNCHQLALVYTAKYVGLVCEFCVGSFQNSLILLPLWSNYALPSLFPSRLREVPPPCSMHARWLCGGYMTAPPCCERQWSTLSRTQKFSSSYMTAGASSLMLTQGKRWKFQECAFVISLPLACP